MPKQHVRPATVPPEVHPVLCQLGERVALARRRRGLRLVDLAKQIGISAPTMVRLERGEPTVSFGAFAMALWALGLLDDLARVGDPRRDEVGLARDLENLPKHVGHERLDNDF